MNTDDKEALNEFARGAAFALGIVGISILMIILLGMVNEPVALENNKFEVVDTYNDRCDVIQYTPTNAAKYFYFLDCKK